MAFWLAFGSPSTGGPFGEAWFDRASLSARVTSVPGLSAGKGVSGIEAGGGVSTSGRWLVAGAGADAGAAAPTVWGRWPAQPATTHSISRAPYCTKRMLATSRLTPPPSFLLGQDQ